MANQSRRFSGTSICSTLSSSTRSFQTIVVRQHEDRCGPSSNSTAVITSSSVSTGIEMAYAAIWVPIASLELLNSVYSNGTHTIPSMLFK